MMHCRMCLKLTDESHPVLLRTDRVFVCDECWEKLKTMFIGKLEVDENVRASEDKTEKD